MENRLNLKYTAHARPRKNVSDNRRDLHLRSEASRRGPDIDVSIFRCDFSGVSLTNSSAPAVYEVRQLDTLEELVQSYRLRYEVYAEFGYLPHPNKSKLDIDGYDACAIPLGAFDATSGTMIGTLRFVTKQPQPDFSRLVRTVLELIADDSLTMRVRTPRPNILPSIFSDRIDRGLAAFNTENLVVSELSRAVVDRKFRGSPAFRGLMEFGLAKAAFGGPALLVGTCKPEHLPLYARYGGLKLPQTDPELFASVGRVVIALVGRTDRLPEPTRSHVDELLLAMRTNAAEHTTVAGRGSLIRYRLQGTRPLGRGA